MSLFEDEKMSFQTLRILPLRRQVLLPGGVITVFIDDQKNKSLIRDVPQDMISGVIGAFPYDDGERVEEGDAGTCAIIVRREEMGDKILSVTLFGLRRVIIERIVSTTPYMTAQVSTPDDSFGKQDEETMLYFEKLKRGLLPIIFKLVTLPEKYEFFMKSTLDKLPLPAVIDVFVALSHSPYEVKLDFLKTDSPMIRFQKGMKMLFQTSHGAGKVYEAEMRNMPIRRGRPGFAVIRVLKNGQGAQFGKEPPDSPDGDDDISELAKKLQQANLPEHASKIIMRELNRLRRMSPQVADHNVLRNYLEFVAELPWSISSPPQALDIKKAKEELDKDHYGLEKLKKRILEYLAVSQLRNETKGPILCFIGPPGVGKTSIARSIARILNKQFQRISLGGVSNQSEIRGHRRTYVGALPGQILQALKQAGTNNPVILLDEVDKMNMGVGGDPRAALLEVLDPEQNCHFTDHYLGLPFDLSKVTFLATANSTSTIPPPLHDRMETIKLSGYTQVEKYNIAVRYLLPKQLKNHGLNNHYLQVTDDAIYTIIGDYTREAGVRGVERKLAAVCRHAALSVADSTYSSYPIVVDKDNLEGILGVAPYSEEDLTMLEGKGRVGVAVGLSWTPDGGQLTAVEVTKVPGGTGKLILTGSLGNVIKESATIALNWLRSSAHQYGLTENADCELLSDTDLHVHLPSGAVSKDGPSAGITIAAAMLSLFSGVPLPPRLALTGEITLQGAVLPVGGVKEKLTAASRMGIKKVIMPLKSKKYLSELSENVLENVEVVLVERMREVVDAAFQGELRGPTSRSEQSVLTSKL